MKERLEEKLKQIKESLIIAERYEVDARMEAKRLHEISISLRIVDERNIDRINKLTEEIADLESIIVDKIKFSQIKNSLESILARKEEGDKLTEDEINIIRSNIDIYNSCKISSLSRPDKVVEEIFALIYKAIKLESPKSNSILTDILSSETSTARVNTHLLKELERIKKQSNGEFQNAINKKREEQEKRKCPYLLDEEVINLLHDYKKSEEAKTALANNINMSSQTLKDSNSNIYKSSECLKEKRTKKESIKEELKKVSRKLKIRITALALSVVLFPSICTVLQNTTKQFIKENDISIESINEEDLTSAVTAAGILSFASLPYVGALNNVVGVLNDKKRRKNIQNNLNEEEKDISKLTKNLNEQIKSNDKSRRNLESSIEEFLKLTEGTTLTEEQQELLLKAKEILAKDNELKKITDQERHAQSEIIFINSKKSWFFSKKLSLSK